MHDELIFERAGFRVTGRADGALVFQTVGTVGLSGPDAEELVQVLAAWMQA